MHNPPQSTSYVVMGVSGCGKSTVGIALASELGLEFVDGDDLHPEANLQAMAAGRPLTDADREPWLASIGAWLHERRETGGVVACSALRRAYREAILAGAAHDVVFIHLDLPRQVLADRLNTRTHFFPPQLLDSQLATLEPLDEDEPGSRIDGTKPVEAILDAIVSAHPRN